MGPHTTRCSCGPARWRVKPSSSTAPAAGSGRRPSSSPAPRASPLSAPAAPTRAASSSPRNGAHHVLDHHAPDYLQQLLRLTNDAGVEIVLEMAAHLNLGKVLSVLAKFGRVIVIGSRADVQINPRDTMSRDADIRGMTLMNATPKDLKGIHQALVEGLANGTLRPVVGKELPLADAAKAHELVLTPGSYGKIVLTP